MAEIHVMTDMQPRPKLVHRLMSFCVVIAIVFLDSTHAQSGWPSAARFTGSDLWKGSPEVRLDGSWYRVCADQAWNQDVAEAFCQHRAFQGVMLVRQGRAYLDNSATYVSCALDFTQTPPFFCTRLSSSSECTQAPLVSCLLPGYHGCYHSSDTDPFYTVFPPQLTGQALSLERCGRDCWNRGYAHFGMAYGVTCMCNDTHVPPTAALPNEDCALTCAGDTDQLCGGGLAISTYDASLGECAGQTYLAEDDLVYVTSEKFPGKYPQYSSCDHEVFFNITDTSDVEFVINYDLDDKDELWVITDSGWVNITLMGGSGRRQEFIPAYSWFNDVLHVSFSSDIDSRGGHFVLYVMSTENISFESSEISSSFFSSDAPPPPPPDMTTTAPPPATNIALYAGVGAAAGVMLLLIIVLVCVIVCVRRKSPRPPPQQPKGDVTAISNAAYSREADHVTAYTANPQAPAKHDPDETHRYATIEGEYYYAPTNGPKPPLPKSRDDPRLANQDAQYEELPGDGQTTPYQSLTKPERQAYQELARNEAPSYTTLRPGDDAYLEPM